MKVLIIGGTGMIGRKITSLALEKGYECSILTRGQRNDVIFKDAEAIICDRNDAVSMKNSLNKRYFDVIVDQTCYTQEQAKILADTAALNTEQIIFTSTACAYTRPFRVLPVTEEHDANPLKEFEYGYNKRLVEKYLIERAEKENTNLTIIRPSLTFGEGTMIGLFFKDYSLPYRLKNNKSIVCPGNGQFLWTITYSGDLATGYVGAFGNKNTYGQVYHLTTDEYHTWEDIFRIAAKAANAHEPDLVHISGQTLVKMVKCPQTESILYDKQHSAVFDNSKAKRDIPDFKANTTFEQTVRKSLAWFEEKPERMKINESTNYLEDRICEEYRYAEKEMAKRLQEFTNG